MPLTEVLAGLRQAAFVLRLYHMHGPAAAVDRAIELLTTHGGHCGNPDASAGHR